MLDESKKVNGKVVGGVIGGMAAVVGVVGAVGFGVRRYRMRS